MQRLWTYEDFVGRLVHPNSLVRTWAFDIIEKRFPKHYTPDVAKLIGDPNEHLACAAPSILLSTRQLNSLLIFWIACSRVEETSQATALLPWVICITSQLWGPLSRCYPTVRI